MTRADSSGSLSQTGTSYLSNSNGNALADPVAALSPVELPMPVSLMTRLSDFLELAKPRIALLALVTVTVGYSLGATNGISLQGLAIALFGIALVATGSSALNQWVEREIDRGMKRTENRPLPAGRMLPIEALIFGLVTGLGGVVFLGLFVNLLTALLSLATLILYAGIYTPLKQRTTLCTTIGAIPGAMPPVLGWVAAGGKLDSAALALFGILFLWQFPHFLAIGWLYREQYARAGLQMCPGGVRGVRIAGLLAVGYALVLLPVSLLPSRTGLAGDGYALAAFVLGLGYLACSVRFANDETRETARGLIWSSLVYLPSLLASLCWDHFQLLR